MAPPFSLRFVITTPGHPPTALVNQESNGLTIKSQHGQRLWDLSQHHLATLPSNGLPANGAFHLRTSSSRDRDHGRTYCTVRVPAQERKYLYKFWLGIGEWVVATAAAAASPPSSGGPQPRAAFAAQCPLDPFYGRRLAPVSYGVMWGLDGLLGCSWEREHARACAAQHWDVVVCVLPAEAAAGEDLLAGLRRAGEKRFTSVRVCADAKVEALFRNLIGYERSTRWESVGHCLTEVVGPCGPAGEMALGRRYSLEYVSAMGTRMCETGWFEGKECVALVPSMGAKGRGASFLFD